MQLDKEKTLEFIETIKLKRLFDKVSQKMLKEINDDFTEVLQNFNGAEFNLLLDTDNTRVSFVFRYGSKEVVIYEHNNYDIYWDEAVWSIARREIKDSFYDMRKVIKEKESSKKEKLTFWQRMKKYF